MATSKTPSTKKQTVTLVPLDQVMANPYQYRNGITQATVKSLAAAIAANGLEQTPIGRRVEDGVELVFGHRRRAAIELLNKTGKLPDSIPSGVLPVKIQKISDRKMFDRAVQENEEHLATSPIERASAMRTAMEEFDLTSAQVGEIFGCKAPTVRATLMLLDLPDKAKKAVGEGRLPARTGRRLVSVARIDPELANQLSEELQDRTTFTSADEVTSHIKQRLANLPGAVAVWGTYDTGHGEPALAGKHGHPLDWEGPPDLLPKLTPKQFMKLYPQWDELIDLADSEGDQARYFKALLSAYSLQAQGDQTQGGIAERIQLPAQLKAQARALILPPACNVCPLNLTLEKVIYCGQSACHKRKVKAWRTQVLQELSEKLGAAIYQRADLEDGKMELVRCVKNLYQDGEYKDTVAWAKWEKGKKHRADFRLKLVRASWQGNDDFTGQAIVGAFRLRPVEDEDPANTDDAAEKERATKKADQLAALDEQRINRELAGAFLFNVAGEFLAEGLAGVESVGMLEYLGSFMDYNTRGGLPELPKQKAKRAQAIRAYIMATLVYHETSYEDMSNGPAHWAKHLANVATRLGIEPPKDLEQTAVKFWTPDDQDEEADDEENEPEPEYETSTDAP